MEKNRDSTIPTDSNLDFDSNQQRDLQMSLQALFARIPEAFYWMDKNGRVMACNTAEAQLFGFESPEQMIGKNAFDIGEILRWDPSIAENLRKNDLHVFDTGESLSIEEQTMTLDGKVKTLLTHKIPYKNKNNEVTGIIGLSIDITDTKNKENDTAHRLKTILEHIPEAVYWIDKDSMILGCNKVEANLFSFESPEQMIGKNIFDFAKMLNWGPGIAEKLRENDIKIMQTGKGEVLEEEYIAPNGELKYFLTHKIPYRDQQGEIVGVVGISVDISERKKLEEEANKAKDLAEAASQAKTVFLNNIRHDTRTPMYGISGSAELLMQGIQAHLDGKPIDFQELLSHAQNALDASNSLCQMFDEIAETVRLYDGKISLQHRKFSLRDQLDYIMKLNTPITVQKLLEFKLDYDNKIPTYLMGDDTVIRRIIQELVVNAIKFTHQGYVRLDVRLLQTENKIATIQIKVSDSGLGIPDEAKKNIFHYFERLSPAKEGRYKGLGAGLFRVKTYLDNLNGKIALESKPRQGTEITLSIPLKVAATQDELDVYWAPKAIQSADKPKMQQNLQTQPSDIAIPDARVLIVEDSPPAAKVTQSILKGLNCQTDLATDGKTAVSLATTQEYDFILMDVGLPDFSGIEATRQIRAGKTQSSQTMPIVALTAHVEEQEKQACLDAGMNAVLEKPLSIQTADDVLSAFIPQRKSHQNQSSKKSHAQLGLGGDLPSTEAQLFELNNYPLFDEKEALKVCSNNQPLLLEIIQMALQNGFNDDKVDLRKAYSEHNWVNVQKIAHKLKSSALCCGAARMSMACQYLERYREAGYEKQLEALYQQLLSVINETEIILRDWLKTQEK